MEIEKVNENEQDGFFIFRTTCYCMADTHSLSIIVERDKESKLPDEIKAEFHINMEPCNLWHGNGDDWFYKRIWNKLLVIKKIIFDDCLDLPQYFIFRGTDHVDGVIEALIWARAKVNKDQIEEEQLQNSRKPSLKYMIEP